MFCFSTWKYVYYLEYIDRRHVNFVTSFLGMRLPRGLWYRYIYIRGCSLAWNCVAGVPDSWLIMLWRVANFVAIKLHWTGSQLSQPVSSGIVYFLSTGSCFLLNHPKHLFSSFENADRSSCSMLLCYIFIYLLQACFPRCEDLHRTIILQEHIIAKVGLDLWWNMQRMGQHYIPEQFTVKAHPSLFEGEGEGQKIWGTLSRGFGLRSFRPEISAWGVFVGRRFRPEEFLSAGDFDLGSLLCSALCC